MASFRHDLRYAVRSLRRHPGFSLVAAGTLALGIGATTSIFSVLNAVLLRPLPYANSDRIVSVWERSTLEPRELGVGSMTWLDYIDLRTGSTSFDALALYRNSSVAIAAESGADLVPGAEASTGFFETFGAAPVLGRGFTDEETRFGGPNVAVVGYGFWQERLGGRTDVIGSTLQAQGTTYEIVGVAPESFEYPGGTRIWLPIQNNTDGCGRGCYLYRGVGLLRAGVSPERARADVTAISERIAAEFPDANASVVADLATLREVVTGDVRLALFVLFGAVIMVLLIACANVANLMLVRGSARGTEMAVRAVLGAGRRTLVSQLVTESTVLALVGTVGGILLATWGVDVLRDHAPTNLPRVLEIGLDGRAFGFAALIAAGTVALFGLVPALRLSRAPFAQTIREGGRGSTGGPQRGRGLILATEVALSIMLLLGAGLMLRSLIEMRSVEPGFDADGVGHFSLSLPVARYPEDAQAVRFIESALTQIRALPGVENAGYVIGLPFGRTRIFGGFQRPDRPSLEPGREPEASYHAIDENYLETMRIPVVAGRNFTPSDRHESAPVVIVNRSFVQRYFEGEDPVGRQIAISVSVGYPDTLPRTIVGVIGDVHLNSLTEPPPAAMYVPEAQAGGSFGAIVFRSNDPDVLRSVRAVMAGIDPQIPLVRPGTMAELLADDTARHAFYLTLIGLFAVLAVTLAAVGMYGVVAFAVAQRTREIGVRMALGARAPEVVSLVMWQGLRPALYGALAGILGALAGGRILAGLLFQVRPQDPLTLAATVVVLVGVVALACMVPAHRATRIPPALALRAE